MFEIELHFRYFTPYHSESRISFRDIILFKPFHNFPTNPHAGGEGIPHYDGDSLNLSSREFN